GEISAKPLAPPPLAKGRSVRRSVRVAPRRRTGWGSFQAQTWIPTRLAALGDLPFARGGGASCLASPQTLGCSRCAAAVTHCVRHGCGFACESGLRRLFQKPLPQ